MRQSVLGTGASRIASSLVEGGGEYFDGGYGVVVGGEALVVEINQRLLDTRRACKLLHRFHRVPDREFEVKQFELRALVVVV